MLLRVLALVVWAALHWLTESIRVGDVMRHHVHGRIIVTLLQGTLTDRWHEACITLWHGRLVIPTRYIRVYRLVNRAVELQQVLKDLSCPEILLTMRPLVCIDHFFALVDESLTHVEQPLPGQGVLSIVHGAWFVLDAGHLEQLHSV